MKFTTIASRSRGMSRALLAFVVAICAHVSAQAPGYPHGGGACQTDDDCSLGGTCAQSVCSCDPWWTGPTCALLNLAPAASDKLGLQVDGYHSWGGHALPDTSGTYHGFFSFMCNHSTLNDWTTKSSIWRATASRPEGPFTLASMVAQPWSHNAMIVANPAGGYLLWQIGTAVTPPSEWAPCYENTTSAAPGAGSSEYPTSPSKVGGVWTGQIFVRSAPELAGPWTLVDAGGIHLNATGTWADANGANGGNPAVVIFPNGTTLLYFTATPCPPGWGAVAPNCIGLARADNWSGPYTVIAPEPITRPESEDAAVFKDPRGNYHMLTNVGTYHIRCAIGEPCGGHAWSRDALAWSNLTIGAFGPVIRFTNGSYWHTSYVERPQVLQSADGTPTTFYVGVGRASYMDSASWAQPVCAAGQEGVCGPTRDHPSV